MANHKISPHFALHEFVPIHIYHRYGRNARWFIRPEVVKLAEFYREWFDVPVTVNNWYWGGRFQERGFRVPETQTGSQYSQHKFGAAFDCNVRGLTADAVREEILNNADEFMNAGLTTLEHPAYAPTWIHSDIRSTGMDEILIVKPATVSQFSIQTMDEHYRWNGVNYEKIIG